ncbi:hypothetical protein BH10PLA2_BH10PLA2_09280 [soil metagenome]
MDARFHQAESALSSGDAKTFAYILDREPDLATAYSHCSHPTLLQCLVLTMPPVAALEQLIALLAERGAELTDPLIAASGVDNVRAVTALLDRGGRIEGNGRWSPLEEALYWGNEATVAVLLERGATVSNLRVAAALARLDYMAQCVDEAGALTPAAGKVAWPFFNKEIPDQVRRDRQQIVGNALVYAAAWGRTESAEMLIQRGAAINFIPAGFDFAGAPLHYAALQNRRSMVDWLLQRGADPALRDTKIGNLPADWAAFADHKDLADYLRSVRL